MHKFNAHGATDITGFGLLGHAKNLAQIQKNEVSFVIHNLPIIAKMAAISKACGNMFGLLQGQSAETSGMYRIPIGTTVCSATNTRWNLRTVPELTMIWEKEGLHLFSSPEPKAHG